MILLIDNYDSFTYNLVQLLRESGVEVVVVRNDDGSAAEMLDKGAKGVVLSPGPGTPNDAGVCLDVFAARPNVPVLGVCLGHQCLGQAWGAVVDRAPKLMHGKTSLVRRQDDPLFEGLPNPFLATRYHSLSVRPETVPDVLEPIAWIDDVDAAGHAVDDAGTIMALRHRELPYWGVQFHPESVLTPDGVRMLRNFLRLCGLEVTSVPPAPLVDPEELAAAGLGGDSRQITDQISLEYQ